MSAFAAAAYGFSANSYVTSNAFPIARNRGSPGRRALTGAGLCHIS